MLDVTAIMEILPHRYPLLLVDRITLLEPGVRVEGVKNVSIADQVFRGHFPGHPVYPGVFIIEGMAQAGGVLAFKSYPEDEQGAQSNKIVYFMSIDRAKFRQPVRPGDQLIYKLSVLKHKGPVWALDAQAFVGDKLVCEAELKAMIADK